MSAQNLLKFYPPSSNTKPITPSNSEKSTKCCGNNCKCTGNSPTEIIIKITTIFILKSIINNIDNY